MSRNKKLVTLSINPQALDILDEKRGAIPRSNYVEELIVRTEMYVQMEERKVAIR